MSSRAFPASGAFGRCLSVARVHQVLSAEANALEGRWFVVGFGLGGLVGGLAALAVVVAFGGDALGAVLGAGAAAFVNYPGFCSDPYRRTAATATHKKVRSRTYIRLCHDPTTRHPPLFQRPDHLGRRLALDAMQRLISWGDVLSC
jgi:hypothetical protein